MAYFCSLVKPWNRREIENLFFKYGPIPASFSFIFVLFTSQINYKMKKHRWSAWDSNQGPQDGRRRRNHGAMALTQNLIFCCFRHFALLIAISTSVSRWPDLTKFRQSGKILYFWDCVLLLGKIFNTFWQHLIMLLGKFSLLQMAKYWKNYNHLFTLEVVWITKL